MNDAEYLAWLQWASTDTHVTISEVAKAARADWMRRLYSRWEIDDLIWINVFPTLNLHDVAERAADAAIEVEAICSLWPERPQDVLRLDRIKSKKV